MRQAVLVALLASVTLPNPAGAQFCPGASGWVYDDVLASDPFCGYITWMAQNGVSLGCQIVDANHRLYCPNADVTRTQIAAFMNRLTTQPDSTSATVGTITKPGGVFLHNFGVDNTFAGVAAGNFAMTGAHNTGVGTKALAANTTGTFNTAIGSAALQSSTTGAGNTATGAGALASSETGGYNAAFGYQALLSNVGGSGNVALGASSLFANLTGASNTAVGTGALYANANGNNNTAAGMYSLFLNASGDYNTAAGVSAMEFNTTASENVAVGAFALWKSQAGMKNVALGFGALQQVLTNSENIGIGHMAGANLLNGDHNIYIANPGVISDNFTSRIGGLQTRAFIAGIRGVTTGLNDAVAVVIDGTGQLGTISSSREGKDDILDMGDASAALMELRPVTFRYKEDHDPAGPRRQFGLIAEEVAEVYPGMVATKNGKPETVMYQYLPPMLLNEFQKQQRTIEGQAREIERQRVEIAEVKASQAREIADLRRAVEVLMARTSNDDRVAAR